MYTHYNTKERLFCNAHLSAHLYRKAIQVWVDQKCSRSLPMSARVNQSKWASTERANLSGG